MAKLARKEEAEHIHAESQRLLRETKAAAFASEPITHKPVSSVLEKIRQRRMQLKNNGGKVGGSCKIASLDFKDVSSEAKASVDGTEENQEIEFVMCKPPSQSVPLAKQQSGGSMTSGDRGGESIEKFAPSDGAGEIEQGGSSRPRTPDTGAKCCTSIQESKSPTRSFLRAPLIESQDLYSDSQLSPFRDEGPAAGTQEDEVPPVGIRMSLHLDSETQDNNHVRWPEEDGEKENRDPILSPPELFPRVSNVRGLIDDEAEDEDDDPLEDEDEEDADENAALELRDLLTQDVVEKPADVERRAELHSKWLEQQDLAMEDDIMQRMESGWKNKRMKVVPSFLNDTQDICLSRSKSSKPHEKNDIVEEPGTTNFVSSFESIRTVTNTGGKGPSKASIIDAEDFQESSDDEEAEERLRRQLFLEESEEQTEFLSVTDDESSRAIFQLINKVNVTTTKPRTATGQNEARTSGAGQHPPSLHHQSSFLRRKATTSMTITKQGSGTSRSYIFGRDDSSSRDTKRSEDNQEQTGKEKSFATLGDERSVKSTTQGVQINGDSGTKGSPANERRPRGPSLFEVLKRQAAELASGKSPLGLNGSMSRVEDFSIFAAIRPSKQPRSSQGK